MRISGSIILIVLWTSLNLVAETVFVPDDHDTIQEAIDEAEDGDIVEVGPGTYIENITFDGKAITVESTDGADSTTIDASALTIDDITGCGVLFNSGEGADSILRGFTITNGSGYDGLGGAIYAELATPVIEDCILTGNSCESGAGIYLEENADVTISGCIITDNDALGVGGGIGGCESGPTVIDTLISDNYAGYLGGGVGVHIHEQDSVFEGCIIENNELGTEDDNQGAAMWFLHGHLEIRDCVIRGNSGESSLIFLWEDYDVIVENCEIIGNEVDGAAIRVEIDGDLTVDRCVIADNDGVALRALTIDSLITIDSSTIANNGGTALLETCIEPDDLCASELTITNSIIWGNDDQIDFSISDVMVSYSCIEGGADGDGNIDDDPEFMTTMSGAYRLSDDSPCIDTGDPDMTDSDDSVIDMGAYAHLNFDFLRGDADGNGVVFPILDALYLLEWGFTNGDDPPCWDSVDIDDNGVVFAILEALAILEWGFTNGDEPPDPGPETCGDDSTEDELDCAVDTCL